MQIKFGTSGWRAIIAKEFTFSGVEQVTNAICSYLKSVDEMKGRPLIIGHDSRFMGESFAAAAAETAASKGFKVLKCIGPTPTPTISHAIRYLGAAGAMNFTASHNPPEYQGIKFSTSDGAPALPEITSQIEEAVGQDIRVNNADGVFIEDLVPKPDYFADLRSKIDLGLISDSGASFAYDPLWGTGRGYLDQILRESRIDVETIHDWRDVTFGGRSPEPAADHLEGLRSLVVDKGLTLGLATDGDGDRFGVLDSDGTYIEPNKLIALLADYLIESRDWKKSHRASRSEERTYSPRIRKQQRLWSQSGQSP
ncbi:hypothetical protein J4558_25990 [Leptolyngbya sp. 15MV]|nr:hypothetical protein J4558_25990 [Leptolyngbya sp. 15MV]